MVTTPELVVLLPLPCIRMEPSCKIMFPVKVCMLSQDWIPVPVLVTLPEPWIEPAKLLLVLPVPKEKLKVCRSKMAPVIEVVVVSRPRTVSFPPKRLVDPFAENLKREPSGIFSFPEVAKRPAEISVTPE